MLLSKSSRKVLGELRELHLPEGGWSGLRVALFRLRQKFIAPSTPTTSAAPTRS
ncbi:hypothetical protein [Hymenobacter sp. YC55]|uniref:hypothetical protein n=1 Tax=Hymenobacter sp. YC55 TaxID=3034019 RepID=UPI0023F917E9|nr:hypothetical protein [Hymenobacter sp. YC55]MDF7813798.1 hypothetical protein [Hymenobacter sp. YC55]